MRGIDDTYVRTPGPTPKVGDTWQRRDEPTFKVTVTEVMADGRARVRYPISPRWPQGRVSEPFWLPDYYVKEHQ